MKTEVEESLFLRALRKAPVPRTPVWIMRQAGRYLPEYRKIRAKAGDFMTLCQTPELACEVTLQPLRRYPLDAAIVFSDILTIPNAMGLGLHFVQGKGPHFEKPIRTIKDISTLPKVEVWDSLGYVMEAIRLTRREMPANLPLIGFAGSPWTLACYMVEGQSSRDFILIKQLMVEHPDALHQLLRTLTATTVDYLIAQAQAGANVLQVFDTWGGALDTPHYHKFSLQYLENIVLALKRACPKVPIILFTKGGGNWLEAMADTKCDALGIDWTCSLQEARKRVGDRVALQGNLNPSVLLEAPKIIQRETRAVLESFGGGTGHIFNLGHGITPDVPPEHVNVLLETVHEVCKQGCVNVS